MLSERELIERFFKNRTRVGEATLGIGDDAAVLDQGGRIVVTTDTMVCDTHFLLDADPYFLGRKSISASLSDLAAMGSQPRYAILTLVLREIDEKWLASFSDGFFSIADEHEVALVGGDVCRGNTVTITVMALGTQGSGFLTQTGAKANDEIWVSGVVGAAGDELRKKAKAVVGSALHDPIPRIELGKSLVGLATSCTDLSDGLCHGVLLLSDQSKSRFELMGNKIPVTGNWDGRDEKRLVETICSGEDYELLFTVPEQKRSNVETLGQKLGVMLSRVGKVKKGSGAIAILDKKAIDLHKIGDQVFSHFPANEANETSLVSDIARAALASRSKVFVAESCTGGLLAGALTSIEGSSDWFEGSIVSYSVDKKRELLGVDMAIVERHGVVSKEVADAMCDGALEKKGVTHAVSITGWAGPEGGDGQEAGTICIGWKSEKHKKTEMFSFIGDRQSVRRQAVSKALLGLREMLLFASRIA